jgi:predicted transcriptional regulator
MSQSWKGSWMVTTETELVQVRAVSEMDDETFIKHFNARHADSLVGSGGTGQLVAEHLSEAVMEPYRAFHRQLHRTRIDLDHYHTGDEFC